MVRCLAPGRTWLRSRRPYRNIASYREARPGCVRIQWHKENEYVQIATTPFEQGFAITSDHHIAERLHATLREQFEMIGTTEVHQMPSGNIGISHRMMDLSLEELALLIRLAQLPQWDRSNINDSIRTLREARDDAFGKDA